MELTSSSAIDRAIRRFEIDAEGCWLWTGYRNRRGYGVIEAVTTQGKRPVLAHRLLYEAVNGEIPEGLELDHLCRVPACVNPDHLEPVTHAENMSRSSGFRALKIKCPQGHLVVGENIYEWRGQRFCRACHRKANREYARRKRAARD